MVSMKHLLLVRGQRSESDDERVPLPGSTGRPIALLSAQRLQFAWRSMFLTALG